MYAFVGVVVIAGLVICGVAFVVEKLKKEKK